MRSEFNSGLWQLTFDEDFMSMRDEIVGCRIPGLSLSSHEKPLGRGILYKIPGDSATWEEMTFTFVVDDLMLNYEKLLNWMFDIYHPFTGEVKEDVMKAATLNMLRENKKIRRTLQFSKMFPIDLSGIDLVTNEEGEHFEIATCTMVHNGWQFEPLKVSP